MLRKWNKKKAMATGIAADETVESAKKSAATTTKTSKKRKASEQFKKNTEEYAASEEEEPMNCVNGVRLKKKWHKPAAKSSAGKPKAAPKIVKKITVVEEEGGQYMQEHEIEDIIDHMVVHGITYYLIRWKGCSKEQDTWEVEETLNCTDVLEKYKTKIDSTKTDDEWSESEEESTDYAIPKKHSRLSIEKNSLDITKTAAKNDAAQKAKKSTPAELIYFHDEKKFKLRDIFQYNVEHGSSYYPVRSKSYMEEDDLFECEESLSCPEMLEIYKINVSPVITDDEVDECDLPTNSATVKKQCHKPIDKNNDGKAEAEAKNANAQKVKKLAASAEHDKGQEVVYYEKEYKVKDIVGHKVKHGISYFLIRWDGHTETDDTWEAEEALSCTDMVESYKMKCLTEATELLQRALQLMQPFIKGRN